MKVKSPEEFWEVHLKRHNSAVNLSNQVVSECVNQNVFFMAPKFGQFSSLENLSNQLYKEHKENMFYVSSANDSNEKKSGRKLLPFVIHPQESNVGIQSLQDGPQRSPVKPQKSKTTQLHKIIKSLSIRRKETQHNNHTIKSSHICHHLKDIRK